MTINAITEKINAIANDKGYDVVNVFEDYLDYIIGYLNPEQTPIDGWAKKYTKEDNLRFYAMLSDYFLLMQQQLKTHEWYDVFGDLFLSIHVKGNNKGQFFTPPALCDLMAETNIGGEEPAATQKTLFGMRVTINDCAAGSSRTLLAAYALFVNRGWRRPYLVAEDLDKVCCKMSAINMCVHGCFGEVICHNSLAEPDGLKLGYIINEGLYPLSGGMPTIRPCNKKEYFFGLTCARKKESSEKQKENGKNGNENEHRAAVSAERTEIGTQLNLF